MTTARPAEIAPRHFQLRCALAYGAPIAVNGIALPYFPVWLESLTFSEVEIGIVLAAPMILRVIAAPVAGALADRIPERANVLLWSGALSLLTALALFVTESFWPVLIVFGLQAAVFAPYVPIVESIAVTGVQRWGFQYGAMRVWGSIGFVVSTLLAGELIGTWGGTVVPSALSIVFLLTIVAAYAAPRLGRAWPAGTLPEAGSRHGLLRRMDLHALMIGTSAVQASHGMFYAFSAIHWQQIGFSGGAIGMLWSAGVIAEILVFFAAGWLARRFSPWALIRLGSAVAIARWMLFPLPLGFWGYLALQCSHAFTFAFVHIGVQHRLAETVGEDQASSAQGAYFFYNGALLALSTFLSGLIYREYGLPSYMLMAVFAAIGLVGVALAARIQPQSAGSGGKTSEPS